MTKELNNLKAAMALEIAFQAIAKIHPTNCDMYNREKFYKEMTGTVMVIDNVCKFYITGIRNGGVRLHLRYIGPNNRRDPFRVMRRPVARSIRII